MKYFVHTIIFDNGRMVAKHSEIADAKVLDCDTYFTKPYHWWERGLSEKDLIRATNLMNNRPK